MELAIAPPNRIPAGSQLGAPLVVTFQASKLKRRPATAEDHDLSGVWAYISLTSEDKSRVLAPSTELLQGNPAATIYPLNAENVFAYAVFPGLKISTPGRYCFRVNIIDMNRCVEVRLPFIADLMSSGAAKLLPAIHSNVFDVVDGSVPNGQCAPIC